MAAPSCAFLRGAFAESPEHVKPSSRSTDPHKLEPYKPSRDRDLQELYDLNRNVSSLSLADRPF